MAAIKRDKRDILFSFLVRGRTEWACERCGKHYNPDSARGLECAHIFSRRYRGTRWFPQNATSLCTSCHFFFTGNPIEFAEWVERHLGPALFARLRVLRNEICKLSKSDLAEIETNLADSLARMNAARDSGVCGRIDFESPYPRDRVELARRVA